jgi:hypothetical protein
VCLRAHGAGKRGARMPEQTTEQLCPKCGCHIGVDRYKKNNVLYCCRACAEEGQCGCGCCDETELPPPEG